ncbi:hypothetical protein [Butyrivibrio sp. INlla14]|uniref:hypothetical protein n=1 Tax=Butyrivibrio sp. INlla14 TaxID=1520808 RepID=UPI000876E40B|nr:hypothetical protein [Butyrivibrio sp. INlla14]SCY50971.1 hypothetical protein SAMN02910371_02566 [Butyrivibrio sp. INlla14]
MRKNVLVSAALAVVMMANVLFTVDAQAVSRTTTVEITGVSRTADGAGDGQVLGARRGAEASTGVTASTIVNQEAASAVNNVEIVAALVNDYVKAVAEAGTAAGQASNTAGSNVSTTEVKAADISVVDAMELKVDAGVEVSAENPLYVSFSVPGVTENTRAWVLHYGANGWEIVPTTVVDGKVIGMFTSLSPVAIVVDKSTLKGAVLGATRKKSPRTGDNFWLLIIAGAGIISASAVALQKKYFND